MSQLLLYLDEDAMHRSVVFGLRARNVDVLTAAGAEMINRDDEDHLIAASASGRVLVAPQQRYAVGEELRRLMRLIARIPAEGMRNRIEFLSAWF